MQAAGLRAGMPAPGCGEAGASGRGSPGPVQVGLCNLPQGRLQGRRRTGSGAAVLPCAAPPAICHPAACLHLPPSDALAGPFSAAINLGILRPTEAVGKQEGRNPGAVTYHPKPRPRPGPETLDSPPLTSKPFRGGRGSPKPRTSSNPG